MWSDNNGPYPGKHYQLAETLCSPQPLSRPHPPILIGGAGEQKTLRLVAQYADACNLFARMGDDVVRAKLDVLQRHCDAVGRDYAAIEKTTLDTAYLAPGPAKPGRDNRAVPLPWPAWAFSTPSSTCPTCTRSRRWRLSPAKSSRR